MTYCRFSKKYQIVPNDEPEGLLLLTIATVSSSAATGTITMSQTYQYNPYITMLIRMFEIHEKTLNTISLKK